jgi:prepilin-type N-terminal cleavage/methylation domain-containing protein
MIESRHTSTSVITEKKTQRRRGFTLVELLMVIALIAMLSSMLLVSLYAAAQSAKVRRTEQQIARIHSLLMTRWQAFQSRAIPFNTMAELNNLGLSKNAKSRARLRLRAIRELMRLEFPERRTDVARDVGAPVTPGLRLPARPPALWKSYDRRVARLRNDTDWHLVDPFVDASGNALTWTPQHQGAECLYMILASIREGDRNGLDFFTEDEIGDVDDDKMPEILDGWGKPIEFLRWAPGFVGRGISDLQTGDSVPGVDGDSGDGGNILDPLKVDALWTDEVGDNDPFTLVPLIFSAGPDMQYGIVTETPASSGAVFRYSADSHPYPNCPFHIDQATSLRFGDKVPDDLISSLDNISNHLLGQ